MRVFGWADPSTILMRGVFVLALAVGAREAAAQSDVWLDLNYPGAETGTALAPFDTLGDALASVNPGGTIHLNAGDSHEVLTINQSVTLQVTGGPARFGVVSSPLGSGAPMEWLRITEIMYHPAAGGAEYLELRNTGPIALDISGVKFITGITFTFPGSTVLAPGEYIVLVRSTDLTLFSAKYPLVSIGGVYAGGLSNGGETLTLSTSGDIVFLTVSYDDTPSWPGLADGGGFSLIIINSQGDPSDPNNWRGSESDGGSPGDTEVDPNIPGVVVNEALTHTDLPDVDSIEFYNPTGQTADIRGWFLSDDRPVPQKAKIPNRAEFNIAPGGYAVIDESDFLDAPGSVGMTPLPGFRLSSVGDEVYLFAADGVGILTGYMHGFNFGGAENDVSFGREITTDGRQHFVAQTSVTLGSVNAGPAVGSLVISEVHYDPLNNGVEYIEITNRTGVTENLFDDSVGGNTANTHRLSGVSFHFPPAQSIPPGGTILVVNSDPAFYKSRFGDPGIPVYGPFANHEFADSYSLDNGGETLRIKWADHITESPPTSGTFVVPYIAMDETRYDDDPPWPAAAANGSSLKRTALATFGSEPTNWTASTTSHEPGGGVVADVTLSLKRGFYNSAQVVSLSTATGGANIWYTLDGSLPAPGFGTSALYGGALPVNANMAIRASAYKAGLMNSPFATATYIIGAPSNQKGAKAFAVVGDPQRDLFVPDGVMAINNGTYVPSTFDTIIWVPKFANVGAGTLDNPNTVPIDVWMDALGNPVYPNGGAADPSAYSNPTMSGRFYERPSSFELLDPNDINAGLQTNAGIRVHGSTFHRPRYAAFPDGSGDWTVPQASSIPDILLASYLKFSLRMYFRGTYGPSTLTWPVFPGDPLAPNYDKVVLRGGHNDGYNPFLKDELTRRLFIDMGNVSARGEIYNLFINGVYKGYYNATERHDTDFLAARFAATTDWDVLTHPLSVANDPHNPQVKDGDLISWNAMMSAAGLDLSIQNNYNAVAAMLDIDAFIDYLLIQLYSGNDDWPNNNYAAAHHRVPGGKWYFLVWDAEATYLTANMNKTGMNFFPFWQWIPAGGLGLKGEDVPIAILYRALVANAGFRSAFQTRAVAHFGGGGALDTVNVTARYTELKNAMLSVLPGGVTYNDFIGTNWIANREAVVITDLQAEGLYP